MFKGVLFDLDGVITDTAEFHYRARRKLGAGNRHYDRPHIPTNS